MSGIKTFLAVALLACGADAQMMCDAGYFLDTSNGAYQCRQCTPGTYNPSSGASTCEVCPAGSYSGWGSLGCVDCAAGYYASSVGAKECTACAAGKYSQFQGQTGPCQSTCPAGFYAPAGSTACNYCGIGSFQPEEGAGECLFCKTSKAGGATTCSDSGVSFRRLSLAAFLVAFTVGVSCAFRRFCFRFDLLYCLERNNLVSPCEPDASKKDDGYAPLVFIYIS